MAWVVFFVLALWGLVLALVLVWWVVFFLVPLYRFWRDRRGFGLTVRCFSCGYPFDGLDGPDRCPECGSLGGV